MSDQSASYLNRGVQSRTVCSGSIGTKRISIKSENKVFASIMMSYRSGLVTQLVMNPGVSLVRGRCPLHSFYTH